MLNSNELLQKYFETLQVSWEDWFFLFSDKWTKYFEKIQFTQQLGYSVTPINLSSILNQLFSYSKQS